MKIFNGLAALAAGMMVACVGASASAAVTYTFSGQGAKTFTYDSAAFLSRYTRLSASSFAASSGNFDTVEFCFSGDRCGIMGSGFIFTADTDTIYVTSSLAFTPPPPMEGLPPSEGVPTTITIGQTFEFASGTFGEIGRTTSNPRFGPATLVVDDGTLPAAVPEPSSWAMMIAGFGLVGAASRRRRAAATFA